MAARKKSTSESVPRSGTDHDCTRRSCRNAGRLRVDGEWWCHEHVPPTMHRNCTHSGLDRSKPDARCPWCWTIPAEQTDAV